MKKGIKLEPWEREIERAIGRGEYRPVKPAEFKRIIDAIARHRKDSVLNIRVNSQDLKSIKAKAKRMGVPYQTLISEIIHRHAA